MVALWLLAATHRCFRIPNSAWHPVPISAQPKLSTARRRGPIPESSPTAKGGRGEGRTRAGWAAMGGLEGASASSSSAAAAGRARAGQPHGSQRGEWGEGRVTSGASEESQQRPRRGGHLRRRVFGVIAFCDLREALGPQPPRRGLEVPKMNGKLPSACPQKHKFFAFFLNFSWPRHPSQIHTLFTKALKNRNTSTLGLSGQLSPEWPEIWSSS